jgi:hypothetical protein
VQAVREVELRRKLRQIAQARARDWGAIRPGFDDGVPGRRRQPVPGDAAGRAMPSR